MKKTTGVGLFSQMTGERWPKHQRALIARVILLCMLALGGATQFSGAHASPAQQPQDASACGIPISNATQLAAIGIDPGYPLSGGYCLTSDISLTGVNFAPIGAGDPFTGTSTGTAIRYRPLDHDGRRCAGGPLWGDRQRRSGHRRPAGRSQRAGQRRAEARGRCTRG